MTSVAAVCVNEYLGISANQSAPHKETSNTVSGLDGRTSGWFSA